MLWDHVFVLVIYWSAMTHAMNKTDNMMLVEEVIEIDYESDEDSE